MTATIAQTVRQKRAELGMTQAEFAELLGVSPSQISMWETGKVDDGLSVIDKIPELRLPQGESLRLYDGISVFETQYGRLGKHTVKDEKGRLPFINVV